MGLWDHVTVGPYERGTIGLWVYGTWTKSYFGTMEIWDHGTLGPWCTKTMGRIDCGLMALYAHQTEGLWQNLGLDDLGTQIEYLLLVFISFGLYTQLKMS